ncbi:hypothetical protein [Streptococcus marimammalium]|uniref:hypothetical protein n=1 Tax=Streptococcus marimammalium TaxID=269666 RepID=UPI0003A8E415|nr:hypothetical protein [Streptococcus marimammalium]
MSLTFGSIVYAATYSYGNWSNGVRSTEQWQVRYYGEAWITRRGHSTAISYYRNGTLVGRATAYKDSWRRDNGRVYDDVLVWDSLNWNAPKTTFYYRL